MFSINCVKSVQKSANIISLFQCNSLGCSKILLNYSSDSSLLPSQAQVVIAGAGVVANSIAYHLVCNGWKDVLILEQEKIGSGTSHFGSGTLGLLKPTAMRNIIKYSIELYQDMQKKGYKIDLQQCGSIALAQTKDRLIALQRRMAYNLPTGLHCELIDKKDIIKLHPYLHTDDIEGAVWIPEDAMADSQAICKALADMAQKGGATYKENCKVLEVFTSNDTISSVNTDKGVIQCEYFINCAGMWARDLGLKCNPPVRIPAHPAEHFYATTGPLGFTNKSCLPCVRDYDSHSYAREYHDGLMVGWFEEDAKPAFKDKLVPEKWKDHVVQDFRHFKPLWDRAVHRFPILRQTLQPTLTNSPDNFTPDGRWILGETAEVKNYFVACGLNGNSLQGAGGIGKAIAEWLIEGRPTQELLTFNVQRFLDLHNNRRYLQQRTKEVVGRHYSILYPHQCEYKYARKLRCSPLYSVLEKRGAVFGIKMAYERALYFDSNYKRGDPLPKMPPGSFYKPKFFDFMQEEYLACREGVGIIDMSSFSKITIKSGAKQASPNAVVKYLDKMCSNDVNIPVGSIVHTGMQNDQGGYENDCILVRQSDDSYFMVSPSSQQTRIYGWMNRHLPSDNSVCLNDVTSMYTVINVVGPKSTQLLSELSNSNINLAPFTYKRVNVGYASDVMVMSFTHTGEPGFCLYVPSEYALHIYDRLMTVGRDYGARDVGTLTQRFMRIEKFIPFWAEELSSFTTPYEAGNGYSVKLDKEYFIGKSALLRQKEQGCTKRLVMFQLQNIDCDKDIWPWGGEPIYRNNEYMGTVTSAGYGFTTNKLVCLGYLQKYKPTEPVILKDKFILDKDAKYEIDIAGKRFSARAHLHAPLIPNQNLGSYSRYRPTVAVSKTISSQ